MQLLAGAQRSMVATRQKANMTIEKQEIVRLACIGQLPGHASVATSVYDFVMAHSGGQQATFLQDLETYEKMLDVKRKIRPNDLAKLAGVKLDAAPYYMCMMLKTMLNAPPGMVSDDGYADVFNSGDLTSLGPNGKCLPHAVNGCEQALAAKQFLSAYSKLPTVKTVKLTSDLEARTVMHVHAKVVASRKVFNSLKQIAAHFYKEAKALDPSLPDWPFIKNVLACGEAAGHSDKIRELRMDGAIENHELFRRGFTVMAKIILKTENANIKADGNATVVLYKLVGLGNGADVELEEILEAGAANEKAKLLTVPRATLLRDWCTYSEIEKEAPTHP